MNGFEVGQAVLAGDGKPGKIVRVRDHFADAEVERNGTMVGFLVRPLRCRETDDKFSRLLFVYQDPPQP